MAFQINRTAVAKHAPICTTFQSPGGVLITCPRISAILRRREGAVRVSVPPPPADRARPLSLR